MTQILEAIYENGVFRPLNPPDFLEGQTVQIAVSVAPEQQSALERIRKFRGILPQSDPPRSLSEELIQERREEAARE
jgi:predicted DNA-binding antitoxin AbrB/MazE fold protein